MQNSYAFRRTKMKAMGRLRVSSIQWLSSSCFIRFLSSTVRVKLFVFLVRNLRSFNQYFVDFLLWIDHPSRVFHQGNHPGATLMRPCTWTRNACSAKIRVGRSARRKYLLQKAIGNCRGIFSCNGPSCVYVTKPSDFSTPNRPRKPSGVLSIVVTYGSK